MGPAIRRGGIDHPGARRRIVQSRLRAVASRSRAAWSIDWPLSDTAKHKGMSQSRAASDITASMTLKYLIGTGFAAFNSGDLATAEASFEQALQLAPELPAGHYGLGMVRFQRA